MEKGEGGVGAEGEGLFGGGPAGVEAVCLGRCSVEGEGVLGEFRGVKGLVGLVEHSGGDAKAGALSGIDPLSGWFDAGGGTVVGFAVEEGEVFGDGPGKISVVNGDEASFGVDEER